MCCKRQVQAKSGHPTENSLVTAGRAEPSGLVPLSCLTELRIMPVKKYPAEQREHVSGSSPRSHDHAENVRLERLTRRTDGLLRGSFGFRCRLLGFERVRVAGAQAHPRLGSTRHVASTSTGGRRVRLGASRRAVPAGSGEVVRTLLGFAHHLTPFTQGSERRPRRSLRFSPRSTPRGERGAPISRRASQRP